MHMRYLSSGHCLVCLSGLCLSCLSNTSHVGPLPGAAIMHNVMSVYVCMYCHQQNLEQRQLSVLNWGANANLAAHVALYQQCFACCLLASFCTKPSSLKLLYSWPVGRGQNLLCMLEVVCTCQGRCVCTWCGDTS